MSTINSRYLKEYNKAQVEEIKKHKWIESHKQNHDIGNFEASVDWVNKYAEAFRAHWEKTHMKIIFMLKQSAENEDPSDEKCIITISNPGEKVLLKKGWKEKIYFNCIGSLFDEKQAKDLIEFVMHLPKSVNTIIVNGSGMVGRLASIANFISEKMNVPVYNKTDKKPEPDQLIEKTLNKVWKGE